MPRLPNPLRLPFSLRRRARRSRLLTMLLLLSLLVSLLLPFYTIYKPPALLIRYFAYRWPDVLFHVPTTTKAIALTIDDAPSDHTAEILDVLRANGAKATFFVIGGQVAGREALLERMVAEGHELGNHAMRDEPSRALSDAVLTEQIVQVEGMLKKVYAATAAEVEGTGKPPKYFRPGSGFFSERLRRVVKGLGYRVVLGSVYPHDPQISWWRLNARHILSMLRPGAVVICHDRRSWTVPMLKRVLPVLRKRGYEVGTVSELLKVGDGEG